jgi:hypothetical protein
MRVVVVSRDIVTVSFSNLISNHSNIERIKSVMILCGPRNVNLLLVMNGVVISNNGHLLCTPLKSCQLCFKAAYMEHWPEELNTA